MASTWTRTQPQQQPRASDPAACVHRWQIEPPDGPQSPGVCRLCSAVRSFANSTSAVMWERSNLADAEQGVSARRTTKLAEITLSDEW